MAIFDQGFALAVGVGADLPNTIDDAVGLAKIFKDPDRCAYPAHQVKLLTGETATRQAVLSALDALPHSVNSQATVIVYFSGHGYRVDASTGEYFYLMPFGYDLNRLHETAISGAEFADRLRAISAEKLLVLLDCCHAGGVGEAKAAGLQMSKSPLPPEARSLLAEGRGRVLIASSQEDELSFAGKPYSAFTLALIEALCGVGVAKKDGYVRVADLALHARQVVPERTNSRQHPILNFEQAHNFALAYYAGGEAQPKSLPFIGQPAIEPEPGAWTAIDQRGQTIHGSQTSIAGDVQGPVFSSMAQGAVAVGGGEAVDLHGAHGALYKPAGSVEQQFGHQVVIRGDVSGQVAVGESITQAHTIGTAQQAYTEANLAELGQKLADLKVQVEQTAPPERKDAALERVEELEEALIAGEPDVNTVAYVWNWFAKNLPALAGAMDNIVVHPVVDTSMEEEPL